MFLATALPASAQTGTAAAGANAQDPMRLRLPTVTVTAQKEPEDKQKLPVSVTAVTADTIRDAGIVTVGDATIYSPNTFFSEFSARKLSIARFRGIGASPGNPAVTTFVDGVPQLHSNSASATLLDIDRLEFVRGPQGTLFGRNTLGGFVNVVSARPTTGTWTGHVELPLSNYGGVSVRGQASGAVNDRFSASGSFAHISRDGFTTNAITGNDLDERSSFAAKGQLLWTPGPEWEGRIIVSGERARDGDYALHDIGALRENPFEAARDFEGRTDRDIFSTTILAKRAFSTYVLTSTTGFVRWTAQDLTDLDYTPLSIVTRDNTEEDFHFTQEVRIATAPDSSVAWRGGASLTWQAGLFFFTQNYEQEAVNHLSSVNMLPIVADQISPLAVLDDAGFGLYGQGRIAVNDRLDLTAGLRIDYESKSADLRSYFEPAIAPEIAVNAEDSFSAISPQFAATYQLRPDLMVYGTVNAGYKAGGFNPASPAGAEAYDEERTWLFEGGAKTTFMDGRVTAAAAVFVIDWNDLQLNVPDLTLPSQFYIANAGSASSKGIELELSARAMEGLDLFGAFGYTHARFGDDAVSNGLPVGGNKLANTPGITFNLGAQFSRELNSWATLYGRAEMTVFGEFEYDDANTARQDSFSLANLRAGVRGRLLYGEVWMRNAFDTRYIPVAFAYPGLAPSGFVGEMGAPRTFGITAGVRF